MSSPDEPSPTLVRVVVPGSDLAQTLDALWSGNPTAVTESSAADGSIVLTAGYQNRAPAIAVTKLIDGRFEATVHTEAPTSWSQNWRARQSPHTAGPFVVQLPEHNDKDKASMTPLVIDPGETFGFNHASTRLALELLGESTGNAVRVADVGCGSGVLGVGAALLGAPIVHCVDIEADAVGATLTNAEANSVSVDAQIGSVGDLPADQYDLVMANLTAGTLTELAPALINIVAPTGLLILSGLLEWQRPRVESAFGAMTTTRARSMNDWIALVLEHQVERAGASQDPALS